MMAPLLNFNLSSLSSIATCNALHAIRRCNMAAGTLIQINTRKLCYCIFRIFLLFSKRFCKQRIVSCNRHVHTFMYLKGHLPLFVSALKGIKFLFSICKKLKNPRKEGSFAWGSRMPSCSLQKGSRFALKLLQKVIKKPLVYAEFTNCMQR